MNEIYTITISLAVLVGIFILINIFSLLGYVTFFLFLIVIVLYSLSYYYPISVQNWIPSIPWLTTKTPKEKTPLTTDNLMPRSVDPKLDTPMGSADKKSLPTSSVETAEESNPLFKNVSNPISSAADLLNKNQVFHVQGEFDYSSARSVCKAYGAKLATFDQIKSSYDKGAEWCDYGWSEDSMVLYPTQHKSWSIYKDTENPQQCGIPGINGGYNNDTSQGLGVNCFGKKPKGKLPAFAYPKTIQEVPPEYTVSPFNYTSWSGF